MIIFKSIQYKNFLSTGNTPIKIDLNKSATTLIIGSNGWGKSTLLDALCFGLFNKPFRLIKKKSDGQHDKSKWLYYWNRICSRH